MNKDKLKRVATKKPSTRGVAIDGFSQGAKKKTTRKMDTLEERSDDAARSMEEDVIIEDIDDD